MLQYALNRNIKKYLNEKRITQRELGNQVGMSEAVISNIVRNRRYIYADELLPICKALGVSVAEIYAE